jgi:hypothetical protein
MSASQPNLFHWTNQAPIDRPTVATSNAIGSSKCHVSKRRNSSMHSSTDRLISSNSFKLRDCLSAEPTRPRSKLAFLHSFGSRSVDQLSVDTDDEDQPMPSAVLLSDPIKTDNFPAIGRDRSAQPTGHGWSLKPTFLLKILRRNSHGSCAVKASGAGDIPLESDHLVKKTASEDGLLNCIDVSQHANQIL